MWLWRTKRRLIVLLVVAAVVSAVAAALFLPGGKTGRSTVQVIPAGRETRVLELLAPLALDREVVPGWTLDSVSIGTDAIAVGLIGTGGESRAASLVAAAGAPAGARAAGSFALVPAADFPGDAAAAIAAAVAANPQEGISVELESGPPPDPPARLALKRATVALSYLRSLLQDGMLRLALILALIALFASRHLEQLGRRERLALVAALAGGLACRLVLSPVMAMEAWPYNRYYELADAIYSGPVLGTIGAATGMLVVRTDFIFVVTLLLAAATPLALFAHAGYLLPDRRVALAAAAVIAFLPVHIRFSRSDVSFIPSLVLSSLSFVLVHASLRDRHRSWRIFARLALPLLVALLMTVRPLNVLFLPLLALAALLLVPGPVALGQRLLVAALAVLPGALSSWWFLTARNDAPLAEAGGLAWLADVPANLFSPAMNTLLNWRLTPPLFQALALWGTWEVFRKRPAGVEAPASRRIMLFIWGWLLLFLVFHSVVCSPIVEMQARYHLHLVAPFSLLVAVGLVALCRRLPRPLVPLPVMLLAVSPFLHLGFLNSLDFLDFKEFSFVTAQREAIPERCTILEYAGDVDRPTDSRFERIGEELSGGELQRRFEVVNLGASPESIEGTGGPISASARELLDDPPSCFYCYEGVLCHALNRTDGPLAPPCHYAREHGPWTIAAEQFAPARAYDRNLDQRFRPEVEEFPLRLFRHAERAEVPGDP